MLMASIVLYPACQRIHCADPALFFALLVDDLYCKYTHILIYLAIELLTFILTIIFVGDL